MQSGGTSKDVTKQKCFFCENSQLFISIDSDYDSVLQIYINSLRPSDVYMRW